MSPADIKEQRPGGNRAMNILFRTSILFAALGSFALNSSPVSAQSKDAEPATRAANDAFIKSLPF
jgi:hypothetical protein